MEQASESADTRSVLLQVIHQNPGIRYRELQRATGLVNGVLTYHLSALEKSEQVRADRGSRVTRYYLPQVSDSESSVIKFVRHEPVREILVFIFENENCSFNEIVDHCKKAPSTISAHLKRLKDGGVVLVRYGEYQLYRVADRELVSSVLSSFRPSYVDRMVDGFAGSVEEL